AGVTHWLPRVAHAHVARSGRPARAGASGKALSLACEEYVEGLEAIETYIGFKLPFEIADETMLVHPLHHPPREHREHAHGHTRRAAPGRPEGPGRRRSRRR